MCPPRDREFMAATIEQMLKAHSVCDVKKRIIRPDGEVRYVRCVGVPVIDKGGFKGFVGTAIDVTEQEEMTPELERRQAYLAEAQRLSHTGSFGSRPSIGEMFWSEAHGLKDKSGTIEFVGAVMDITTAKQVEETIRQQEMELRQILDLTPQHVGVLGPDGSPLYGNHIALDYSGVNIDQWRAEGSQLDLVHPDDRDHFLGEREKRFREEAPHEFEARL